jgi:hypothetical protein
MDPTDPYSDPQHSFLTSDIACVKTLWTEGKTRACCRSCSAPEYWTIVDLSSCSFSDPDSVNPDPNIYFVIESGSDPNPDPDQGFYDQKIYIFQKMLYLSS